MSRASKIFLGSSIVVSGAVIYGVHWIQKYESDTMYQGVIRDEIRVREKAAALKNSTPPLNTPSAPVQQPASVIDENCETCRISPPPQLLEAQTSEERRREREARGKEYLEQKGLGERLVKEQGGGEGTRMI